MVSRKDIIESIKAKIESGEWPPGFRLPSTSQLARDFGVSESTVTNAVAHLTMIGLVYGSQGAARWVVGGPADAGEPDAS